MSEYIDNDFDVTYDILETNKNIVSEEKAELVAKCMNFSDMMEEDKVHDAIKLFETIEELDN